MGRRCFAYASLASLSLAYGAGSSSSPKFAETELLPFVSNYAQGGHQIYGWAPPGTGHPVFIHTPGTHMPINSDADIEIMKRMASFGFVAATAAYDNMKYPHDCKGLDAKAKLIYEGPDSALENLCMRTEADCSKGVAVYGFSQGAHLASLAADYDSRVSAALLFGNGNFAGKMNGKLWRRLSEVSSDIQSSKTCLLSNGVPRRPERMKLKTRSIAGGQDIFMGHNLNGVIHEQQITTGDDCGKTERNCLRDDGSGYYVTKPPQRTGHIFFLKDKSYSILDPTFRSTEEPYGFKPNFDWLAAAALSGAPVEKREFGTESLEQVEKPSGSSNWAFIAALVVAIALPLGLGIFCWRSMSSRNEEECSSDEGFLSS